MGYEQIRKRAVVRFTKQYTLYDIFGGSINQSITKLEEVREDIVNAGGNPDQGSYLDILLEGGPELEVMVFTLETDEEYSERVKKEEAIKVKREKELQEEEWHQYLRLKAKFEGGPE